MSVATLDTKQWTRYFTALGGKLKNQTALLRAAFSIWGYSDVISHFKDERGPENPWQKRAAKTQAAYARIYAGLRKPPSGAPRSAFRPSNKLLQLTGFLRKSLLVSNIRNKGRNSIEFYSNAQYSGVHDRGSTKKGIPQREFMWLSDGAKDKMANFISDEMEKA